MKRWIGPCGGAGGVNCIVAKQWHLDWFWFLGTYSSPTGHLYVGFQLRWQGMGTDLLILGHSSKSNPPFLPLPSTSSVLQPEQQLKKKSRHLPPPQFKKLLTPGKIGQILCLGNLTDKETYDFLRGIAPDLQIVKGDFDVEAPNLALSKVVTHGSLRIGFTHGHTIIPPGDADSLLIAARHMDVDVLLWGGTHRFEAYELEGKFFVNPGSATGAFSTAWWAEGEEPTPSFCLMDVRIRLVNPLSPFWLVGVGVTCGLIQHAFTEI